MDLHNPGLRDAPIATELVGRCAGLNLLQAERDLLFGKLRPLHGDLTLLMAGVSPNSLFLSGHIFRGTRQIRSFWLPVFGFFSN